MAATLNAAHALGQGSTIGSLEPGKRADLLMLSVPDYREIPYHFGINMVNLVMKSGAPAVAPRPAPPSRRPSPRGTPPAIPVETRRVARAYREAITAATLNAAHAIGRGSTIGSLEPGKSGDLLMLSVPDYREIPYHFGVNMVNLVMKAGAILVERSEVKWPVN